MPIAMTDAATRRLAALRTENPQTPILRVGIRGGGCSGFTYFLDFVAEPQEKDKVFEFADGVKVCVDRKSYVFLNGTELDFQEGLAKTGFVFHNPQAKSSCSCGESFSL